MQSKRIGGRGVRRGRNMPHNLPRFRNKIKRGSRQRRHVQRLADVASRIGGSRRVMVQHGAARGKKQQGRTAQQGQRSSAEYGPMRSHHFPLRHLSVAV
jgi:hypothetical protein